MSGYAFVLADGRYGFGPGSSQNHPEFDAIEQMLRFVDDDVPLMVHTDSQEAILRFEQRIPAKPTNKHVRQVARILMLLHRRPAPVEFRRVLQDVEVHDLHAAAHYLAFLGRSRTSLPVGNIEQTLSQIQAAGNPNAEAHDAVIAILFPDRNHPGADTPPVTRLATPEDPTQ